MKKNKYKKGFTLVELLAVIVILAVLILLATPAILNLSTNAQLRVFVLEANTISEVAERVYIREGASGNFCITLRELVDNRDLRKTLGDNWSGKVTITTTNDITTSRIWLTDGAYWIDGENREEIAKTNYSPLTSLPNNFNSNVTCP